MGRNTLPQRASKTLNLELRNYMKKTIYLNAGHSEQEPGALSQFGVERDLNIATRDELIPELKRQGFRVEVVPDKLTFAPSIDWVIEKAEGNINAGLALSIHQNSFEKNGTKQANGAETWYYAHYESSRRIAKALIDPYCEETGIKNRGAKSDSTARFGALSWIRKTPCWATLIECGFMDSKEDMDKIIDHFDLIARGICKGVCKVYGIKYKTKVETPSENREEIKEEIIKLLKKL